MRTPKPFREPAPSLRAWARFGAVALNMAVALALLAVTLDRLVPPQHLPWTPFSLDQPLGLFTAAKLQHAKSDPARCRHALTYGGVSFRESEARISGFCSTADSLRLGAGATPLSPGGPVMACPLALEYALWERQVVRPAARELLGAEVRRVEHLGTYACRRVYGQATGPPSAHARAAALDVSAFDLMNGRRVSVLRHWNDQGPRGAFLRRVRDGACRVFRGALSPDYNAAHADHLHLDDGRFSICR